MVKLKGTLVKLSPTKIVQRHDLSKIVANNFLSEMMLLNLYKISRIDLMKFHGIIV